MIEALPWAVEPPSAVPDYRPGFIRHAHIEAGRTVSVCYAPPTRYGGALEAPAVITEPTMMVTLISDASLNDGAGGWAAYARSARGVMPVTQGKIKAKLVSTLAAELTAFANGLHRALAVGVARPGDTILAQIDNVATIDCIERAIVSGLATRKRHKNADEILLIVEHCRKLARDNRLTIKTRHIKAHSGTADPRLYIHDQCDRAARAARKA